MNSYDCQTPPLLAADQEPANRPAGVHRPGRLYERPLPGLQPAHHARGVGQPGCRDQRQHHPEYVVGPRYRCQDEPHA